MAWNSISFMASYHQLPVGFPMLVIGYVPIVHLALVLLVDPSVMDLMPCLCGGGVRDFKVHLFQSYVLER